MLGDFQPFKFFTKIFFRDLELGIDGTLFRLFSFATIALITSSGLSNDGLEAAVLKTQLICSLICSYKDKISEDVKHFFSIMAKTNTRSVST